MEEIGIMGGYFNPIHNWHLLVGDCAAHQFKLKKVLYIPSGEPPHDKQHKVDGNIRFRFVQAGVEDNPLFEASRIEIDRPGVTWTIDTMRELKKQYGDGVRLNFIIGADNIKAIAGYDKRAELVSLCRLLVACRGKADPAQLAAWRAAVPEAEIEAIDCPVSDLSSTIVRDRSLAGLPYRYLVPAKVYVLIEELQPWKAASATAPVAAPVPDSTTTAPEDTTTPPSAATPAPAAS